MVVLRPLGCFAPLAMMGAAPYQRSEAAEGSPAVCSRIL